MSVSRLVGWVWAQHGNRGERWSSESVSQQAPRKHFEALRGLVVFCVQWFVAGLEGFDPLGNGRANFVRTVFLYEVTAFDRD